MKKIYQHLHANVNKANFSIMNTFIKNSKKEFHILLKYKTNINFNKNFAIYNYKHINKNFSQKNVKLDPYLILEVNRGADFKTIKAAYFKLARVYHPDANQNDEVININIYINFLKEKKNNLFYFIFLASAKKIYAYKRSL